MAERLDSGPMTVTLGPYADNTEYIHDEMRRLDLLLHIRILEMNPEQPPDQLDSFRGLVMTEQMMVRLLTTSNVGEIPFTASQISELQQLVEALWLMDQEITKRKSKSLSEGISLALPQLIAQLQLSHFEEQCLIACLAPEWDVKYGKLYAYLQDDVTCKEPTVDLLLKLMCNTYQERAFARQFFHPQARLMENRLIEFIGGSEEESVLPLLSRSIRMDHRIAQHILGYNHVDSRLHSSVTLAQSGDSRSNLLYLSSEQYEQVRNYTRTHMNALEPQDGSSAILLLHGPSGSGKRLLAEKVCDEIGCQLILGDLSQLVTHPLNFRNALFLFCREAWLHQAAICLQNMDLLFEQEHLHEHDIAYLLQILQRYSRMSFLLSSKPYGLARTATNFKGVIASIDFPLPDIHTRTEIWNSLSKFFPCQESINFHNLAVKFQFTPGRINAAFKRAHNRARWRSPHESSIIMSDLQAACYEQTNHNLSLLADKIPLRCSWEDIILPVDQLQLLREIIHQVRYKTIVFDLWGFGRKLSRGKGLNVLFHGPPGTGKTTAAEVIAKELGLELFRIDLSQVVSKYIGETEKNLQRVFLEAQESYAILFFDEADAIFGKRTEVKDAHDRHANTEIAYLLQKMEEYDGMTILATNLLNNLDEAFIRRMQFSVSFPLPDEEQRYRIWEAMFPASAPRGEDVDFAFLAHQFNLSGGHIKNIVHTAAFLAAEHSDMIRMEHLIRGVKREMDKMGRMVRKEDFGPYYMF